VRQLRNRGAVLLALWLAACGGRAISDEAGNGSESDAIGGEAGSSSTGAVAGFVIGGSSGVGFGGSTSAGGVAGTGAQVESICPDGSATRSCTGVRISLGPNPSQETVIPVTVLQYPSYGTITPNFAQPRDPKTWDRSPLPSGACVFRVHGFSASCLMQARMFVGLCSGQNSVAPTSFYETNECSAGILPGCPSSDPGDSQANSLWYVQTDDRDFDIVVCAAECAVLESSGGACLALQ
jgi:hypothetical protein